ncbi:MAG TPA: PaaX family transcriptional regulator C-terminal domain-containing protein [Acidimicrobiales bacterium]|nr:PaaX family transcriptional regulator C-terminal domain-containing protein [Acidimicrobiales bacterium]
MPPPASTPPVGARTELRRQALAGDSARGLLLTVLGELVLPSGGPGWTAAFIDALGRLDVEPGTTRQALARTAAAGWLRPDRVGRRTSWWLTPSGEQLLVEGTERIYGFAGPAAAWDGRWIIVLASVPESDRRGRHFLRTRLTWAGLGSPSPGVWVGTHPERRGEVEDVLRRAGVAASAQVFVGERLGRTPAADLVAQAWDLSSIDEEYRRFAEDFGSSVAGDPLTRTVELVHAWRRFPWIDPALPAELLPEKWKGGAAADLFRRRHNAWSPAARLEWARLNET